MLSHEPKPECYGYFKDEEECEECFWLPMCVDLESDVVEVDDG